MSVRAPAATRSRTISWWAWTAVAEDHGLEQRRPAEIVDVVDVDIGLQERPHHLDVAAVGRRDQSGAAEAVGAGHVGVGAEHLLQHVDVAGLADGQERVRAGLVLEIDVRARVDERADDRGRACVGRCGDRRPVALAAVVGRGTAPEQIVHRLQVAPARCAGELALGGTIVAASAAAQRERGEHRKQPAPYSTVTVLARLRGWSTLWPRRRAIR